MGAVPSGGVIAGSVVFVFVVEGQRRGGAEGNVPGKASRETAQRGCRSAGVRVLLCLQAGRPVTPGSEKNCRARSWPYFRFLLRMSVFCIIFAFA